LKGAFVKEQARRVLDSLKKKGASYADIRIHLLDLTEKIGTMKGDIEYYDIQERQGFGIRVLVNGAWGFASSEDFDQLEKVGDLAVANARAASAYSQEEIRLAPKETHVGEYATPSKIDPFSISPEEKINRLLQVDGLLKHEKFSEWSVGVSFFKREILYLDSEGADITRRLVDVQASMTANGLDKDGLKQRRSYEMFQNHSGTTGWENILDDQQFNHAERVKAELLELLDAPVCEEEVCDVILKPEMMALQTHETIGHALELDRILGYELSYAGGSHIDLQHFGELVFGSDKLTARADGTVPNSPGSTGFDDDGVRGRNVVMIEKGKLKDAITSRQMIVEANNKAGREVFKQSGGACRAQTYSNLPIERMNNINIDAGHDGSLEDFIKNTKNGLLMESPKSWSIGSNRENFHFATEVAWKIKDGKITHMVRNATYRGDSIAFWKSLDMVGDESTWQLQQVYHCGKGQPNQVMRLAHGVPLCRFKNVQVGK
jgi:TldD protein